MKTSCVHLASVPWSQEAVRRGHSTPAAEKGGKWKFETRSALISMGEQDRLRDRRRNGSQDQESQSINQAARASGLVEVVRNHDIGAHLRLSRQFKSMRPAPITSNGMV